MNRLRSQQARTQELHHALEGVAQEKDILRHENRASHLNRLAVEQSTSYTYEGPGLLGSLVGETRDTVGNLI